MPGALLGGLLLGLTESLAIGLVSPTFSDLIAFGFLIIVLLLRPAGIAGRAAAQKV
jgi:branched-chain amino acid transport system permease protein